MAIKLTQDWNGHAEGAEIRLDDNAEAALVRAGAANFIGQPQVNKSTSALTLVAKRVVGIEEEMRLRIDEARAEGRKEAAAEIQAAEKALTAAEKRAAAAEAKLAKIEAAAAKATESAETKPAAAPVTK